MFIELHQEGKPVLVDAGSITLMKADNPKSPVMITKQILVCESYDESYERVKGMVKRCTDTCVRLAETPVEDLCNVRLFHALQKMGVKTIIDMATISLEDLVKQRGIGKRTIDEAEELLEGWNLQLGMTEGDVYKNICDGTRFRY